MRTFKSIFVTTILTLFIANVLFAQVLEPVKWSFDSKKISETKYELIMKATIENKWHLYSQFIDEGGPIPTSFNSSDNRVQRLMSSSTISIDSIEN